MAALLYILAKLVLLTSLLECAHTYNDSAGMSPPPQQLSLPYSRIKLGRKDKCRHAVRKEVRRYSGQVRALTSRLSQLQKDIAQLRGEHNRKHQELESLKFNMSSQTRLLQETMQSLHDLQESVDQLEGKKKWQPAVPAGERLVVSQLLCNAALIEYSHFINQETRLRNGLESGFS